MIVLGLSAIDNRRGVGLSTIKCVVCGVQVKLESNVICVGKKNIYILIPS